MSCMHALCYDMQYLMGEVLVQFHMEDYIVIADKIRGMTCRPLSSDVQRNPQPTRKRSFHRKHFYLQPTNGQKLTQKLISNVCKVLTHQLRLFMQRCRPMCEAGKSLGKKIRLD